MLYRRPQLRLRPVLLILAMGMISGFAPRAAFASGCHVDERPSFGLTRLDERDRTALLVYGTAVADDPTSNWAPRPCSDGSDADQVRTLTPPADFVPTSRGIALQSTRKPPIPENERSSSFDSIADLARPPR